LNYNALGVKNQHVTNNGGYYTRTNMHKHMRLRWRQSWGDLFDLLLRDRDLRVLLIIAVLGALVGITPLIGLLMFALR
jgi:hypothetical protein